MMYIGCSININARLYDHKSLLSSGSHVCRMMCDDYRESPDSFQFFPIKYVDESVFTLPESIRNHLFSLESQHIKRVPLAMLYNSMLPASLSEKLLLAEQPPRPKGVPIVDIINRLGMSMDSIRTNNLSASDVLSHEKAVEFLQKRTVANGRFPEEKAAIAREYLAELTALSVPTINNNESLLIRGGIMDYFEYTYPKKEPEKVVPPKRWYNLTILDVVFYATTLTTCAGLVTLLQFWGLPVALVYSLILVDAMETAKKPELEKSAQTGAAAVIIFEMIAACVHVYLFNRVVWYTHRSLPFEIKDVFVGEKWIILNEDKPFMIAVGIAIMLSGSAVYAIEKSIVTAREQAKNVKK